MAAAADDDVGEGTAERDDVRDGVLVRRPGQHELDHADGVTSVGHRYDQVG